MSGLGLRFAWVLGWAIPPEWFRPWAEESLPDGEHVFFEPSPSLWAELSANDRFDWLVGYSLGSLLLLQDPQRAEQWARRIALLAPIWAFPAEAGAGGRISRANLRALNRAYRKNPSAALGSFYQLVERVVPNALNLQPLSGPNPDSARRGGDDALHLWGLEQLDQTRLSTKLPANWPAWIGEHDSLLDAFSMQALEPTLTLVPQGTHHPAALIAAFAQSL